MKKIKRRKRKILRGQPGIFLFLEDECNKQFGKKPKGRGKARQGSTRAEDLLKVSHGYLYRHAMTSVTALNPVVKKILDFLDLCGYRFFIVPKDDDPEKPICVVTNEVEIGEDDDYIEKCQ